MVKSTPEQKLRRAFCAVSGLLLKETPQKCDLPAIAPDVLLGRFQIEGQMPQGRVVDDPAEGL